MIKKLSILLVLLSIFLVPNFVKAESLDCNEVLYRGDKTSEVKVLQRKLNKILDCSLVIDGSFGPLTQKCVIKFQKKYNLSQDGIVGPKTCSKINSEIEKIASTPTFSENTRARLKTNKSTATTKSTTKTESTEKVEKGDKVVVTGTTVNIRKSAGTSYKIQDEVKLGTTLTIYGSKKTKNTTWYKVKVDGKYGYISGEYAKPNCILVDKSKQELTYYKNGSIYMTAKVVTGMKSNHDTPTGHYTLKVANKETERTLRGTNDDGSKYASYVDYWMPFITSRGIGFHDADWRDESEYTADRYTYDGSHGCINMQKEDAKKLYESTTTNTAVVITA